MFQNVSKKNVSEQKSVLSTCDSFHSVRWRSWDAAAGLQETPAGPSQVGDKIVAVHVVVHNQEVCSASCFASSTLLNPSL